MCVHIKVPQKLAVVAIVCQGLCETCLRPQAGGGQRRSLPSLRRRLRPLVIAFTPSTPWPAPLREHVSGALRLVRAGSEVHFSSLVDSPRHLRLPPVGTLDWKMHSNDHSDSGYCLRSRLLVACKLVLRSPRPQRFRVRSEAGGCTTMVIPSESPSKASSFWNGASSSRSCSIDATSGVCSARRHWRQISRPVSAGWSTK